MESRGCSEEHRYRYRNKMEYTFESVSFLVNIVTSSEEGFDEEAYVNGLLKLPLTNNIGGILRTF